ncbi:Xaa-Pro aminopeptidase [Terriglobus roseus]|uniref:Xaa-Pro aminopeptidase n=2 Tax=Terriglobus roseus TaxID=392734 RepID=A0A1H4U2Y6_9BACT|nr:Xaa-Pro aminopeptidase [Terriglobus roseus]
MAAKALPAMLITHLPDVRYLTGFTGSNAALVVVREPRLSARLFTDGRYTAQAKEEVAGATVRIAPKSALAEACAYAATHAGRCGFDRTQTTVATLVSMRTAARKAGARPGFFAPFDGSIATLRAVKDDAEAKVMRRAAALTCDLYEGLLSWVEAGMRERDIAAELEHRARLAGAQGMSFETIVAAGERSSHPHAHATDAILQPGDLVTLDFGIVLDGYCSDMTRTFAVGFGESRVPAKLRSRWAEQRDVFEAVLAAQVAAVRAVRTGVTCGDVDEAARSVLTESGWGKFFTHSTGHGVGLEIHEGPRVAKGQTQRLEAGMVITIEPGVYLPGRFGVRIEDTVRVTGEGAEVLTPVHKGWLEL